jgi:cysteine-rich repeat protein
MRNLPNMIRPGLLLGLAAAAFAACGDGSEPVCGDGYKLGDEQCDDGNGIDNDSCSNACVQATCGDGVVQLANNERCDDGNADDGDGCTAACELERCGDGVVSGAEACDDGNADDLDACRNTCEAAACGDGVVQVGVEACDDGNDDDRDACTSACAAPSCGDEVVQPGTGEQCDDGNNDGHDACRNNCLAARCGDGVVHDGVEACDDGNLNDHDDCRNNCEVAVCGDGVVLVGTEECDDANAINTDECTNGCRQATCGDGFVQAGFGEECDDANEVDTDACVACAAAVCGDGIVHSGVEECDDMDLNDGDLCSNDCQADCFPNADWRYVDPLTEVCYGFYDAVVDWGTAEDECTNHAGHLVSLASSDEQALVMGLVDEAPIWVGYNDRGAEGEFVWSDGSDPAFSLWFPGEPNDVDGEDCAEAYVDGWNDLPCGLGHPFVCERTEASTFLPGVQQDLDPSTLVGWSECYVDTYGAFGASLATVLAQCDGADLMMGCRPTGRPRSRWRRWRRARTCCSTATRRPTARTRRTALAGTSTITGRGASHPAASRSTATRATSTPGTRSHRSCGCAGTRRAAPSPTDTAAATPSRATVAGSG